MKFGEVTGEIWPKFSCKFQDAYMTGILLQAICSRAKAIFSTDRGAVSVKFFSQKNTLQASESIKKRILVHWMEFQALKLLKR